jgi:hypothetical protein
MMGRPLQQSRRKEKIQKEPKNATDIEHSDGESDEDDEEPDSDDLAFIADDDEELDEDADDASGDGDDDEEEEPVPKTAEEKRAYLRRQLDLICGSLSRSQR